MQANLRLETEGKEPTELKIHKDVRNLKIWTKLLKRITGMSALTDLEELEELKDAQDINENGC
ncbi:hypothetical protein [Leptospira mayottensis]|uniref:Uncharacterized protein n=2 Tax=Leptospira mayottensis TaxID=1137606 RepID=A0AA87SWG1_9LEPT|nr:hypothetical protein [Leptospira mayottensis]AXR60800.1 hypothetical protein DQM68_09010 [Leptospira mayottensis]AXR64675.1 hypothetical protein DQM28_11055 [Leptospira mayottensis]AXR68383.1 hypothetical protein DPV73_10500 [Leptospira mayottensis]AZQ02768.1 hypothetical protein LEP1GSC190_12680 [Leptospira mayottensis 200901116]EKR99854.1 hypothetical protein LEP1GSC125_1611 [Leptospira mayottensis 200901122]